ncbi:hypothetical protein F5I97DRAFT_1896749, partial [Phlebopus sp. FC_14]
MLHARLPFLRPRLTTSATTGKTYLGNCWFNRSGAGTSRPRLRLVNDAATFRSATFESHSATLQSASYLSELVTRMLSDRESSPKDLHELIRQYDDRCGHELDLSLPAESAPSSPRKATTDNSDHDQTNTGVVLIAHAIRGGQREPEATLCSGFAIGLSEGSSETMVLTCTHTLEKIRASAGLLSAQSEQHAANDNRSGSWVIADLHRNRSTFLPVESVLSALRRADLLLLSMRHPTARCLAVSPYPVLVGARVYAHFVTTTPPRDDDCNGWQRWICGTWRKWTRCEVTGYRDHLGRVARVGTDDYLYQMIFHPPPPPGSSGGPIVDASGAVVGVILGTTTEYSQVRHGWGAPAQIIYEMFSLPIV